MVGAADLPRREQTGSGFLSKLDRLKSPSTSRYQISMKKKGDPYAQCIIRLLHLEGDAGLARFSRHHLDRFLFLVSV